MTSKSGPGNHNNVKRLKGIRAYVKEVGSVGSTSALMGILAMVVPVRTKIQHILMNLMGIIQSP